MNQTSMIIDRHRLQDLAVSQNGFAFDPKTGQSFSINKSGQMALDWLQQGNSPEETARKLADTYQIAPEIALGSVEGFIRQLARCLP